MPFVNIRMIEGRSQAQKDEIAKRVNAALSDVLALPQADIWIVLKMSRLVIGTSGPRLSQRCASKLRNEPNFFTRALARRALKH